VSIKKISIILIVTIAMSFKLPTMMFYIRELNILKLIATSFVNIFSPLALLINRLICSQNLILQDVSAL